MSFINSSNGPYQSSKGDLVAGTGSGGQPTIISVGSNSQILTADSTQTGGMKWANASGLGGKLVLIQSQTASSSASLNFTSGLSFNSYLILISGIMPDTNNTDFRCQVSFDGGSTYENSGYNSGTWGTIIGDSINSFKSTARTASLILTTFHSTSGLGYSGSLAITNANTVAMITGGGTYFTSFNAGEWAMVQNAGKAPTGDVNALSFSFSPGNIASGIITLYGYLES